MQQQSYNPPINEPYQPILANAYFPDRPTVPVAIPEWRRVMIEDGELFTLSLPCVLGCCFPNVIQALAAWKISSDIADFLIPFCCYPLVACCYRSKIKRSLGIDMSNDSCLVNCLLHLFCSSCATGQEFRAAAAYCNIAPELNQIPERPIMY